MEPSIPECPYLPSAGETLGPWVTRRHGKDKTDVFYQDALRYAQWFWLRGKPAQAILQLNKAWMADLRHAPETPPPYQALTWIMHQAASGNRGFMGNPVRHFQHLASRMGGPRAMIRSWRAWFCHHLAKNTLGAGYARDGVQIIREGLWIPGPERALHMIRTHGWPGEAEEAERTLRALPPPRPPGNG